MRLTWRDLGASRADRAHGKAVEIAGWPTTALPTKCADYFLLTAEPNCCPGCVPANRLAVVEIFAADQVDLSTGPLRLTGTWHVVTDDPGAWRYQLRGARAVGGVTRRALLAASPLVCLPAPLLAQDMPAGTVDIHSHAGRILRVYSQNGNEPFTPVAEPMRQGRMAVLCLAIVADSPVTHVTERRIRPYRNPRPGELYEHGKQAFARLHRMVREEKLSIIRDAAGLRAASADRPSVIVSSEGADFLEGKPERVDEAYERWQLRHLQLTHYRVNELGDIQTEPAEQGGLTDVGVEVVRRCNRLGIVIDVAHGTFDLVKKAASVTTKPLVLSHTGLTQRPNPWTRFITPDHAKAIAATGGVIGVWPVTMTATMNAYVDSIARMIDQVGVDHVGIGTDSMGLLGSYPMSSYAELPQLAAGLRRKYSAEETAKILGGNYRRVFEASLV